MSEETKPMSRQRKWQLKMIAARRCTCCGEPTQGGTYCVKCQIRKREERRVRIGSVRRYYNSASYKPVDQPKTKP